MLLSCTVSKYNFSYLQFWLVVCCICTEQDIKCTVISWKMCKIGMIVYHHNNIHYDMILVIWFVVIENSPDIVKADIVVQQSDMSSVHDDSGNLFLIVLSYKEYISDTKLDNILTKKWLYMIRIWLCVHIIFHTAL